MLDHEHLEVRRLAEELAGRFELGEALVRGCVEWVRDQVEHSSDFQRGPLTCVASDVLRERTGYCYAKAHLLVCLLRANGLPAALCYQRLTVDDGGPPFCVHGLAAAWLPAHGWVRLDPRGNKAGVDARFEPPREQLAFALRTHGECDLPGLYAEPRADVVESLRTHAGWRELYDDLLDVEVAAQSCCIAWAGEPELPLLQRLEMEAGQRFREVGRDDVADANPLPLETLVAHRRAGRVFAARVSGELAGFVVVGTVDGEGHVEELSVSPAFGRRGLGSQLLEYAAEWARVRGLEALTLSTFRDVAFNAPFYARRGFVELPVAAQGPELAERRAQEEVRGLSAADRVCMRRVLSR